MVKLPENLKTYWQRWWRSPDADDSPEIVDVEAEPIEPLQKDPPQTPWPKILRIVHQQEPQSEKVIATHLEEEIEANLLEQNQGYIAKVFRRFAQRVNPEDIERIKTRLGEMRRGPIKDIWQKVQSLAQLIKDPQVAWRSKAMAIAGLLYLVSPLDAVPDVIPFAGLADDAAVIIAVVSTLAFELEKYMTRQAETKAEIEIKKHTTNVRITLLGSIAAAAIAIIVKIILNTLSS